MSIGPFRVGFAVVLAMVLLLAWLLLRRRNADWFGIHLRGLPIHRLRYILVARFLRMASVGFLVDVVVNGRMSRPLVLLFALLFGLCGPMVLLLRQRPPAQRVLFGLPLVLALYGIAIIHWHGAHPAAAIEAEAFRFDAVFIFITALASAFVTTQHINTEGARQFRAETELEAAGAVQQVLVPDEVPSLPGFRIESVYRPAGEVGGDFFQILPAARGGLLIVIGDVSGKGMPAAMTVSLLVGTVRTLASYTESPGEILAAMNRHMLGRSHGGFTTCLVLRMAPDGEAIAANAGHLAPWINGQELALDNGLPLGLNSASTYAESAFELIANAQLTLVSDGVVEARNARGELFGFDRACALSTGTAASMARAAQDFGQEDDITVLTLRLVPTEVLLA